MPLASSTALSASRPATAVLGSPGAAGADASPWAAGAAAPAAAAAGPAAAFLRARTRVGSASTQLHYVSGERATHASEMPARARAARAELAAARAADSTRWRAETGTYREAGRRVLANFDKDPTEYVFNHRAEELPAARPVVIDAFGTVTRVVFADHFHRTAEMPVHARLAGKAPWAAGTQTTEKERAAAAADFAARAAAPAAARARERRAALAPPYVGVSAREAAFAAGARAARGAAEAAAAAGGASAPDAAALTRAWTASIRDGAARAERLVLADPASARERALAAAPPRANSLEAHYSSLASASVERLVGGGAAARAAAAAAARVVASRAHSGAFDERVGAWSCCAAGERGAAGCVIKTRDASIKGPYQRGSI
jgi:hypothetical protein